MKKALSVFPLLIALLLLVSCSDGGAPLGMKTAADGQDGYRLYVPSEWVVHQDGDTLHAYVSALDTTGIVLTHRDLVEGDSRTAAELRDSELPTLEVLPEYTPINTGVLPVNGVDAAFVLYTHKSGDTVYRSDMYYLVAYGRCYIFSFTVRSASYADYEKMAGDILSHLAFSDARKEPTTIAPFPDEGAPEGMMRASSPEIAPYRLYAPIGYKIKTAVTDTLVYVSESDRSSFSVYPTVPNETSIEGYLTTYKESLRAVYSELVYESEAYDASFGERSGAYAATFTGVNNGIRYRVRQYMMYRGLYLYIFTYTARDTDCGDGRTYFEKNLADIDRMIAAFRFEGEN